MVVEAFIWQINILKLKVLSKHHLIWLFLFSGNIIFFSDWLINIWPSNESLRWKKINFIIKLSFLFYFKVVTFNFDGKN